MNFAIQKALIVERKADLERQLADLEAKEKAEAAKSREVRAGLALERIDTLIKLSRHSSQLMEDKQGNPKCPRCFLLNAQECGYFDSDMELTISIKRAEPYSAD